jgi:SAM-dependent methyltransferase
VPPSGGICLLTGGSIVVIAAGNLVEPILRRGLGESGSECREGRMSWRSDPKASRRRFVEKFDASEVEAYESVVGKLSAEDEAATLEDLGAVFAFEPGMRVLDVGAGTGTVCELLSRIGGLSLTALEPARPMLDVLTGKPELRDVVPVEGFTDAPDDRVQFGASSFDLVISRQVGNSLVDPLAAFANWRHWLEPGGAVIVMDGLYDRDSWSGRWEEAVDALPLSCHRTMALVPYLLEVSGFEIAHVGPMTAVNARPTTRTPRYVVVAKRPSQRLAPSRPRHRDPHRRADRAPGHERSESREGTRSGSPGVLE